MTSLPTLSRRDLALLPREEKIGLLARLPPKATEEAASLTRYRSDPVAFVREVLGAEPWQRQADILTALAREPRVSVRSCNGAGKTLCAAWASLWYLYTRPGSIVITTAPTGNQVKNLLWRRLRAAHAGARSPLPGRCQTMVLEVDTEWYAQGLATDEEVRFQGPHSPAGVLMVGDEASGLAEWMFTAMQGTMTEPGAKMLLIGNPNQGQGTFYDSQRDWPAAQRFHISAFDVPEHVLRPSWREEMLADYGEESPVYQVRVLGEFPAQGDDALISLAWVTAAQEREAEGSGEAVLGADISRYGSDESVAYVRRGAAVIGMAYWRGNDTLASAGRIAVLAREHGCRRIQIDDIGVGGGVTDQLLAAFAGTATTVIGVNVGETARDSENYANKRSEIFHGLAERFRDGDIAIPKEDDLLMSQLVSLRRSYTPRGQMKLESKDDLRKRRPARATWLSPDRADALALAFCEASNRFVPWSGLGQARAM